MARKLLSHGKKLLILGLALFFILTGLTFNADLSPLTMNRTIVSCGNVLDGRLLSPSGAQSIMSQSLSGFPAERPRLSWRNALLNTGIMIDEPFDMLTSNIQHLTMIDPDSFKVPVSAAPVETPSRGSQPDTESEPVIQNIGSLYPPVGLYCTHTTETYFPNDKCSHTTDRPGLICEVAQALDDALKAEQIRAIFNDTIHDSPDFTMAYANSRETVEKMAGKEPDFGVMIDVHRDSAPKSKAPNIIVIEGKKAAGILLVVGSDQRKPNPEWKTNQAFAQRIFDIGQKKYPGLITGIRIKAGTYNQEIHPPSILVEFGNEYNTIEESKYSAQLLAKILEAALIREVPKQ
ncbi:MAG: stage II sporulation protein P [Acidobacteriota bacterium]